MVSNQLKFNDICMKIDPVNRGIYRKTLRGEGLVRSEIIVKESDLLVLADREIAGPVREILITERDRLERYIAGHPEFRDTLAPIGVAATAPAIVRSMAAAGATAGVGPMAAVAGAICDAVAAGIGAQVRELIIENGGDLFVRVARERVVGIFAGDAGAPALGLRLRPEHGARGICTSSGRIGHSLSFGDSAAATVVAGSAALADAAATAVGNRVRGAQGIREGLAAARAISGVLGAVILREGELGAWGEVELVDLAEASS